MISTSDAPPQSQLVEPDALAGTRRLKWKWGPALLWILLMLAAALLLQYFAAPLRMVYPLDPAHMSAAAGYVVSASLPPEFIPDELQLPFTKLTENGVHLSRPVRARSMIEHNGSGRFLFRGRKVYFSSLDKSNPVENGRSYEVWAPRKVSPVWLTASCGAALLWATGLFIWRRRLGFPSWRRLAVFASGVVFWALLLRWAPEPEFPPFAVLPFVHLEMWRIVAWIAFVALGWAAMAPFSNRLQAAFPISDKAFLAAAILLMVLLRLPACFRLEGNPDESDWIEGANLLAKDPRFWISFDGATSGPLVVFPLLLMKLCGASVNYLSVKLFVLVLWSFNLFFIYRSVALLLDPKVARLALLPLVFVLAAMDQGDYIGYNGEQIPVLLLATALFCHARLSVGASGHWHVILLGMALGAIPYAKLQAVPLALVVALFAAIQLGLRKDRRFLHLIAGGLIPSVLMLVYLQCIGAFGEFVQSYLLYNIAYAKGAVEEGTKTPLEITVRLLTVCCGNLGYFFFFWSVFLALGLGWMVTARVRGRFPSRGFFLLGFGLSLVLAALYCVHQPHRCFAHYLFLLLLPGAYLLALLMGIALSHTARQLSVAVLALGLTVAWPFANCARDRQEEPLLQTPVGLGTSPLSQKIQTYVSPGETMAIWGGAISWCYLQTGLISATRAPASYRQQMSSPYQQYYIDQFIQDLETHRAKIFLAVDQTWRSETYKKIADYVTTHFHPVAEVEGAVIYLRNDP